MYLEHPARIVRSSSICHVVHHLLSPILSFQCGSISYCFRRVVSRPCQMRPHVQPPPTPYSRVPCAHPLHSLPTRALFPAITRSVLAIPSLCVFILALPVKVLSILVPIRYLHSPLCGFDRSSIRCQRCTTKTTSSLTRSLDVSRQHVESSWLNLWRSFNNNPSQWKSSSFFVRCGFLCQLQPKSHPLPWRATQAIPIRRIPCIAQCLSCPTLASHKLRSGNAQNCSCSILLHSLLLVLDGDPT